MTAAQGIIIALLGMMVWSVGSTVSRVGKTQKVLTGDVAAVAVIIMMLEIAGLVYVAFQL